MPHPLLAASAWSRWHDPLAIILLVLVNPALYLAGFSSRSFSPDSSAYMALGRAFADGEFTLFLQGWTHVDTGLILPPLYPLLIAALGYFGDDFMRAAEWLSWVAMLLTTIPLYLLLKPRCGRALSMTALFVLQLNAFYFGAGFMPLTEALFTLLLATLLLTLDRLLNHPSSRTAMLLGFACGALVLTRQIGLAVAFFALAWLALATWFEHRRGASGRHVAWSVILFLLLTLPYAILLHHQTGQGPLVQSFSLERYSVERPAHPPVTSVTSDHTVDYAGILEQRQQMRRLLPDGSEMIGHVKETGRESTEGGVLEVIAGLVSDPLGWLARLAGNMKSLADAAGLPLFGMFLLSLTTPLLTREEDMGRMRRYLPAGALLTYLGSVSLFTDSIPRYAEIMLPLLMVAAVGETATCVKRVLEGRVSQLIQQGVLVLLLLAIALILPAKYQHISLHPQIGEADIPISAFRQVVTRNEAVFSPQPIYGYLSGGTPRTLPIGSLEQVVTYGRLTGVSWLLMVALDEYTPHSQDYLESDWYGDLGLAERYPRLLKFCCTTGDAVLYRILQE